MSAANNGELKARRYDTGQPTVIRWDAGRIVSLEDASGAPEEVWLAPPLVDLQINGYAGIDFQQNNVSLEQLEFAAQKLAADGCTTWFLTLMTDEWPRLMTRLRVLSRLRAQSPLLQQAIAGWHIEGPFLSPAPGFCGAHNPTAMCDPKPEHILELREIAGDAKVMLTMAPERTGALIAIERAAALGMKVSLGHTNASAAVLVQAIQAGATGFTHLGNGCPSLLDRHDNIVWRVLDLVGPSHTQQGSKTAAASFPLTASLIPDQIHVSPVFFRLVHRLLGAGRIYYTTDAMAAAGAPPGHYTLGPMKLEVGADQVVRLPGHSNFAGSALSPIEGVFRAASMLGASWRETWRGFSEAPAKFAGLKCRLELGSAATFCVVQSEASNQVKSLKVFRNGCEI